MFEIGDMVVVNAYETQVIGKIVSYHYDEGDVWTVRLPGGQQWDFGDHELAPAHSGG